MSQLCDLLAILHPPSKFVRPTNNTISVQFRPSKHIKLNPIHRFTPSESMALNSKLSKAMKELDPEIKVVVSFLAKRETLKNQKLLEQAKLMILKMFEPKPVEFSTMFSQESIKQLD